MVRGFLGLAALALSSCGGDGSSTSPTQTATTNTNQQQQIPPSPSGSTPEEICVNAINSFRATIGLGPLLRWTEAEACSSTEAEGDAASNAAHAHFGDCGEMAQNECPGWPGAPATMIIPCLTMMWNEGPGVGAAHGHYNNMTNSRYTKVACGFYTTSTGRVWAIQNFK